MDEPTSVLTPQAVEKLFETLRQLAARRLQHPLHQPQARRDPGAVPHARRCCAAGKVTGTCDPRTRNLRRPLARMMIGGDLPQLQHRRRQRGRVALVARGLSLERQDPFGMTLDGHRSHGARRRDRRHRRRFGQRPAGADGRAVRRRPARAAAAASCFCGADVARALGAAAAARSASRSCRRSGSGAAPCRRCRSPTTRSSPRTASRCEPAAARSRPRWRRDVRARPSSAFNVKAGGPDAAARSLSGGNLQKFIVGREIRRQAQGDDRRAADVGRRRRRRRADPPGAARPARRGLSRCSWCPRSSTSCSRSATASRHRAGPAVAADRRHATAMPEIGLWMSGLWAGLTGRRRRVHGGGGPCSGLKRVPSPRGDVARVAADRARR